MFTSRPPRSLHSPAVLHALRLLCSLLLVWLVGCAGPLRAIDEEAAALILRRQALSLGNDALLDRRVVPVSPIPGVSGGIYATIPPTINPSPYGLPARAALDGESRDVELPDAVGTPGETPVVLDLPGVLGYAIEHGPTYRGEKEDLFLAALSLIVERHLWGPRFFDTVTASVAGTPERGDTDTSLRLVNDFTVTQRLPYGGRVAASALVQYVNFIHERSTAPSGRPQERQTAAVSASIDLPLLRGAGIVAREPLIQAERNLIYAARDFERFRRGFFVEIATDYLDLLRRRRQIENLEVQLQNLEQLAERFTALAEAGKEPYFEAERAQQQVLFGRSTLLNAREVYRARLDTFKLVIGMPVVQELVLEEVDLPIPLPELDPALAVRAAWTLRLDLQNSADRVEDARRRIEVAENRTLPDLDVFADVTVPTEGDDDIGGLDFDAGSGDYRAGVRLGLPLDRKIQEVGYRRSLVVYERLRRRDRLLRDRVALSVRRAIRDIEQSRFTLELQERNVELSERRAIAVRLRERTLGPRDVIDAQEDLLEARNRRDAAASAVRTSILQYLLATGQVRVGPNGQWAPPTGLVGQGAEPALPPGIEREVETRPVPTAEVEGAPDAGNLDPMPGLPNIRIEGVDE